VIQTRPISEGLLWYLKKLKAIKLYTINIYTQATNSRFPTQLKLYAIRTRKRLVRVFKSVFGDGGGSSKLNLVIGWFIF